MNRKWYGFAAVLLVGLALALLSGCASGVPPFAPPVAAPPPPTTTPQAPVFGWRTYDVKQELPGSVVWRMAAGPDGTMWFALVDDQDTGEGRGVARLDRDGGWTRFSSADGLGGDTVIALAAGAQGDMWVAAVPGTNLAHPLISRLDAAGRWRTYELPPGLAYGELLVDLWTIAVTPDGALWTHATAPTVTGSIPDVLIARLSPEGEWSTFGSQQGLAGDIITALAASTDGGVWFAAGQTNQGVGLGLGRLDPNGAISTFDSHAGPGSNPIVEIAPGPDGSVWLASLDSETAGNARISRLTPEGAWQRYEPPVPLMAGSDYLALDAWDIEVDAQGSLWSNFVGDSEQPVRNGVARVTPAGEWKVFAQGEDLSGDYVVSMALGPDGALWFSGMATAGSASVTRYGLEFANIPNWTDIYGKRKAKPRAELAVEPYSVVVVAIQNDQLSHNIRWRVYDTNGKDVLDKELLYRQNMNLSVGGLHLGLDDHYVVPGRYSVVLEIELGRWDDIDREIVWEPISEPVTVFVKDDGGLEPECLASLSLVLANTDPPGERKSPGEAFQAIWTLQADSRCGWPGGSFTFLAGNQLGAPSVLSTPAMKPSEVYLLQAQMRAPEQPGAYWGSWWTVMPGGAALEIRARVTVEASAGVPVPNVLGKSGNEASAILSASGFQARYGGVACEPAYGPGIIVVQDPKPGVLADPALVTVVVKGNLCQPPACNSLTVQIEPAGKGSVQVDPSPTCAGGGYAPTDTVVLRAAPAAGCTFSRWIGDISAALPSIAIRMVRDYRVTAIFTCQQPDQVLIPDVRGLSPEVARAELAKWGFGSLPDTDDCSASFPQGVISAQKPQGGQYADPKTTTVLLARNKCEGAQVTIHFSADDQSLAAGACTMLRWQVDGAVSEVTLDGQPVNRAQAVTRCPMVTTSYTLRVRTAAGETIERRVIVEVGAGDGTPVHFLGPIRIGEQPSTNACGRQVATVKIYDIVDDTVGGIEPWAELPVYYPDSIGLTRGYVEVRGLAYPATSAGPCPGSVVVRANTGDMIAVADTDWWFLGFEGTVTGRHQATADDDVSYWVVDIAKMTTPDPQPADLVNVIVEQPSLNCYRGGTGIHVGARVEVLALRSTRGPNYVTMCVSPEVSFRVLESQSVAIPDVRGLTPQEAAARLTGLGFSSASDADDCSSAYAQGVISRQAPLPGTMAAPATTTVLLARNVCALDSEPVWFVAMVVDAEKTSAAGCSAYEIGVEVALLLGNRGGVRLGQRVPVYYDARRDLRRGDAVEVEGLLIDSGDSSGCAGGVLANAPEGGFIVPLDLNNRVRFTGRALSFHIGEDPASPSYWEIEVQETLAGEPLFGVVSVVTAIDTTLPWGQADPRIQPGDRVEVSALLQPWGTAQLWLTLVGSDSYLRPAGGP